MASSAAVSCKAAVNAARLGSRSKSGVPKMAVRAPRRSAVSISATMAGDDDFVVPAAAPPPPQVFNAASIKVRPGHPRSRAHRVRPSANISLHEITDMDFRDTSRGRAALSDRPPRSPPRLTLLFLFFSLP